VNVFARELKIPLKLGRAWEVVRQGREIKIDLPRVEFQANGVAVRRYFAQLAGAGLDARAIEMVNWGLKKKVGPLAYIAAGLRAMKGAQPTLQIRNGTQTETAELVLVGNGRLYGGAFEVFPRANLSNGLLEACLFPKVTWPALVHCGASLLTTRLLPKNRAQHLQAKTFELSGPPGTGFEVDGEWCGHLPATFSIEPLGLRVVAP
jgi:diacylglycerol kinase family enzyme